MYTWYYIFNAEAFTETALVSRTYTVTLDGIGKKDILVTQGHQLGLSYDGVFLPLELNGKNPFTFEDRAAYIDEDDNVWLGIAIPEDDDED